MRRRYVPPDIETIRSIIRTVVQGRTATLRARGDRVSAETQRHMFDAMELAAENLRRKRGGWHDHLTFEEALVEGLTFTCENVEDRYIRHAE